MRTQHATSLLFCFGFFVDAVDYFLDVCRHGPFELEADDVVDDPEGAVLGVGVNQVLKRILQIDVAKHIGNGFDYQYGVGSVAHGTHEGV